MDKSDAKAQRPSLLPQPVDKMRHFARDRPMVKLCALFIDKLPAILTAAGGLGGLVFWLRWH